MKKPIVKKGKGEPTKKELNETLKAVLEIAHGKNDGVIIVSLINKKKKKGRLVACSRNFDNHDFDVLINKLQEIIHPEILNFKTKILKDLFGTPKKKTGSPSKKAKK